MKEFYLVFSIHISYLTHSHQYLGVELVPNPDHVFSPAPVTPTTHAKDDLFLRLHITPISPLFFRAWTPLTLCTDHPLQISILIGHASLHLLGCHQATLMIPSSSPPPPSLVPDLHPPCDHPSRAKAICSCRRTKCILAPPVLPGKCG